MAVVPIHTTVPPSDLVGQPNGKLPDHLLTSIGPGAARLHHTVARGWFALKAAAIEAGGWALTWTSTADTYRTYEVQVAVFVQRYQPVTKAVYDATPNTDQRRRIWVGALDHGHTSIYWIKRNIGTPFKPRYPATAAVPGTSPHGMGCAVDGALPNPAGNGPVIAWTAALPWLIANVHRFGFAWSLQSEPWHIQWMMGDVIPQAVLDYEAPTIPAPPPPTIPTSEVEMIILDRKPDTPDWDAMAWTGTHLAGIRGGVDLLIAAGVQRFTVPDDEAMDRIINSGETTNDCPPSMAKVKRLADSWAARRA